MLRTRTRDSSPFSASSLKSERIEVDDDPLAIYERSLREGWGDGLPLLPATEERRESVPMRRYGSTEEIAATVAFLASEGAGYITGQNIRVDGGLMRSV